MKRFHLHLTVEDLSKSVAFYSRLFGGEPSVVRDDYAKWMLSDPRINFAISTQGESLGLDHVGFQLDSREELLAMEGELRRTDPSMRTEMGTTCCYARSNKYWLADPQGVSWEIFETFADASVYLVEPVAGQERADVACCVPSSPDHVGSNASCCT